MADKIFTTQELIDYCKSFGWLRVINQIHIHHTWNPSHKDFTGTNGLQLVQNMRAYHMSRPPGGPADGPYRDIAQHLTLLPDGKWVTGRDFNDDPASIAGWNTGAFAIEILGNFDMGGDPFKLPQSEQILLFTAFFSVFKMLSNDQIKFHRDNPTAGKTCPGSAINKQWFLDEVNKRTPLYKVSEKTLQQKYDELSKKYNNLVSGIETLLKG